MKRKSHTFYKNLLLGTEFDKYLIEHPHLIDNIPDGALMILLPQDDPDLCKENLQIAKAQLEENGQSVVYVKIKKLAPASRSRIIGPKIEYAKAG